MSISKEKFKEMLREKGLKVTNQRILVLESSLQRMAINQYRIPCFSRSIRAYRLIGDK